MGKASNKICRERQKTNFIFSNFFSENRAVFGIMWTGMVEPGRIQMTKKEGICALNSG
jgi:hypothetical protein